MVKVLRILVPFALSWSCICIVFASGAQQPVRKLQITLRGKRYEVADDVTTVRDLHEQMKKVAPGKVSVPQSVMFDGRRLQDNDILSEAGVTDGAQLNMVPAAASSASSSSTSSSKKKSKAEATVGSAGEVTRSGASEAKDSLESIEAAMQDYLNQAGVDTDKLEDMMKSFGGAGGDKGEAPSMKESLEMMNSMMQSDLFQSYLSDPDKLEQSRQMILNNPMLKSMMAGMPGMDQILNDPVAWREAMQAAASMYKNMDPDTLMSMMSMGGAGAASAGGAGPGGIFDGTLDPSSTAAAAALDELDEDE